MSAEHNIVQRGRLSRRRPIQVSHGETLGGGSSFGKVVSQSTFLHDALFLSSDLQSRSGSLMTSLGFKMQAIVHVDVQNVEWSCVECQFDDRFG